MKEDNIASIPTVYRSVKFRSRLEATWAAFFDRLEWNWQYEPFDLNGWTPDFSISFPFRNLLVEIKPRTDCPEFSKQYLERYGKYVGDGNGWILIAGSQPYTQCESNCNSGDAAIGKFIIDDSEYEEECFYYVDALLGTCKATKKIGIGTNHWLPTGFEPIDCVHCGGNPHDNSEKHYCCMAEMPTSRAVDLFRKSQQQWRRK